MIETLVVCGAAGDLTGRLLLPALASLRAAGQLPPAFRLVAADRHGWTDDGYAAHARRRLDEHAPWVAAADRGALLADVRYRSVDVGDAASVAGVIDAARRGTEPVAVYLALPTGLMPTVVGSLRSAALPPGSRIAVEKPFGTDEASAVELNAMLAAVDADPAASYRVDHVLAMPALAGFARAVVPGTDRPIVWDAEHIAQLDILFEETLGLEGRASFYDRAGALRDVVQNHSAQVLCTMAGLGSGAAALRAVHPPDAAAVRTSTRRARYTAGRLADGRDVPDYTAEDGVDAARDTETYAELVLYLDTPRWAGTRFLLRAGKALDARRRGVRVHLRGADVPSEPVWLDLDHTDGPEAAEPAAYTRVLADLLGGGSAFSVSAEEAELAWRVFTPVLQGWADDLVPLLTYRAGSEGPAASK